MRQSLIPMSDHLPVRESKMTEQLPESIMKKAVRGIGYIAHPLRLRILEYIDVNGASSVSAIRLPDKQKLLLMAQPVSPVHLRRSFLPQPPTYSLPTVPALMLDSLAY